MLTQYVKDCHTNLAECSDDESIEEISNHLSEIARVTRHFKEYLQVEENIENLDYPSNLLFSNSLLEAFEKIARDLFNDESYEDAANTYFLLASIRPSTPIYWLSLGIVEHKLKNHSQAIQAYVLALVNDPTLVQAHYHKGLCYLNLEQDKLAKISLDKALELLSGKEDEISLQLRNEIEAHVIYRLSK